MKYIVVALAGAADVPAEELGGKTPFELAKIPTMHHFAKIGKVGQVKLVSDRGEPTPDATLINLLGYDADQVFTGRGPLEAANLELKLESNEVAFRMNFITEADGILADPTGGNLTTKEARALINFLNKKMASGFVRFFAGADWRHIAVLKDSHGLPALSARTLAPENLVGERIDANLPKGPGEETLKKLMYDAKLLLQDHEINQVRVDLNENPANMIWLSGQGSRPDVKRFQDFWTLNGAMIADMEFAKGFARLAGLTVLESGLPENEDARYEKIAKTALEIIREKDFVVIYLEACETASRNYDLKAKVSALESIDFFLLARIREYLEQHKDLRVLVTPCHAVSWKSRKMTRDLAPFVVAGKNVVPDDVERFSEASAKVSSLKIMKSSELMKNFLSR